MCNCYTKYYGHGRCTGTKEIDACSCDGDETKCDFYPEKRARAMNTRTFNTAEMWLEADKDGEMYKTCDGSASYSKETGFVMENLHMDNTLTLSDWLVKRWYMQEKRKMTKAEAEKEFGIKIID